MPQFTTADLDAYLDEALPPATMAAIEKAARENASLAQQLAAILAQRGAGVHSLGEVWRMQRLGCLTRQQLGSYLLGALPEELMIYARQHVEIVGCRCCQANLADLQQLQKENATAAETRRRKYFQSSAGYLRRGG